MAGSCAIYGNASGQLHRSAGIESGKRVNPLSIALSKELWLPAARWSRAIATQITFGRCSSRRARALLDKRSYPRRRAKLFQIFFAAGLIPRAAVTVKGQADVGP